MNDLISRQNTLDALKEYEAVESDNFTKTDPISKMTVATIANCIEVIWEMPSAEPKRKKGMWIYDGIRGRFPACKCSICGHYENADWALLQGVNFCPHCGADMKEEDIR